jgi:hypothetical protein
LAWRPGDAIVRRDVWRGQPWVGLASIVVQDKSDLLALYVPEGAEVAVAEGKWPIVHPWSNRGAWTGHGVVMLHRPGDAYSAWVLWDGPSREFAAWYLNLEQPFVRSRFGIDTKDYELDLWSTDGRTWLWKDAELLEQRAAESVYTADEIVSIKAEGARLHNEVTNDGRWWDDAWAEWEPPADWIAPRLPTGWQRL